MFTRRRALQASSEHSISVAIDAAGAAGAKKVTREAFSSEIRHGTVAVDIIRQGSHWPPFVAFFCCEPPPACYTLREVVHKPFIARAIEVFTRSLRR